MKPGSILKLDRIKVYFPFFKGKDGNVQSLHTQGEWIASYLLLCDVVVIPPRAFFHEEHLSSNFEVLLRNRLLKHLFNAGHIVTASTQPSIRDLGDLLEYYHTSQVFWPKDLDMMIYDRDETYQRRIYSDYLKDHINSVHYYDDSAKSELTSFLDERPNHPTVIKKLDSLVMEMERPALNRLRLEAINAYFLGGAEGNAAIMPPSRDKERSLIYNPFYSKNALYNFKSRLESTISRNILSCSPSMFSSLRTNLMLFRYKYSKLSEQYQTNYLNIVKLLAKSKMYVDLPLVAIYAAAATTIACLLAPIISKNVFATMGAVFTVKFLWNSISKILRTTDKLSQAIVSLLKHLGVFSSYRREVSVILGEFESSVEEAIMAR